MCPHISFIFYFKYIYTLYLNIDDMTNHQIFFCQTITSQLPYIPFSNRRKYLSNCLVDWSFCFWDHCSSSRTKQIINYIKDLNMWCRFYSWRTKKSRKEYCSYFSSNVGHAFLSYKNIWIFKRRKSWRIQTPKIWSHNLYICGLND